MLNKYAVSYEKDLGGMHRFYNGKKQGTWSLREAQFYDNIEQAERTAKELCIKYKFARLIYIHEWSPQMLVGETRVVKII
jgi:hypothetical protein